MSKRYRRNLILTLSCLLGSLVAGVGIYSTAKGGERDWEKPYSPDKHTVLLLHLNEEKGIPQDSSTYRNPVTVNGAKWDKEGKFNGGYEFNGTGDYIECGKNECLNTLKEFTYEAWLKPLGRGNHNYPRIIYKGDSHQLSLIVDKKGFYGEVGATGKTAMVGVKEQWEYGEWVHVKMTYSDSGGRRIRIYVNGLLKATSNPAEGELLKDDNMELRIGGAGETVSYEGIVDEVHILSRADDTEKVASNEGVVLKNDGPAEKEGFCLKSAGKNFRAIVIADKPAGAVQFAAEEFQKYIRQATGKVLLPIYKDSQQNIPLPAVLIGPSALTRKLGLNENKLPPEGFYLKTIDQYLVIAGNDHPLWSEDVFKKQEWVFLGEIKRQAGTRIGTLFGVYTFLQEFADIGWYFPGILGEVVPQNKSIVVPELDRVESPDFKVREIGFTSTAIPKPDMGTVYDGLYDLEVNRRFLFRLRTGKEWAPYVNHSMWFWGDLFGKDHPEYFALIDGKRTNDWGWTGKNRGGGNREFCWANPATVAQQIEEMRKFFAGEIERHKWVWVYADKEAYPVVANDGTMKPCECELCQKWINQKRGYRASQSDLYAYHLKEVAEAAKKEFPGKYILGLAYGPRMLAPAKVKLPDNVLMGLAFVMPATMPDPETKQEYDRIIDAWSSMVRIPVMWEYTDAFRYYMPHIPLVLPHAVGEEIKARYGKTEGFYFCHQDSDVFSELELYVASQLMWNAEQDVDTVIDRFMRDLYGPASAVVKEIYLYLENLWTGEVQNFSPPVDPETGINAPNWKLYPKDRMWFEVFTPEKLEKAMKLLENAQTMVKGDRLLEKRVERVAEGLRLAWAESTLRNYSRIRAKEAATTGPAVACPSLKAPLTIDGTISDKEREDTFYTKMQNVIKGGKEPSCPTELWLGRDKTGLYIGVKCHETEMDKLAARINPDNLLRTVFTNDVIEIFLDTQNSCYRYYQIGVDAAGQVATLFYRDGPNTLNPEFPLSVKAQAEKQKTSWTAEIYIPFAEVGGIPGSEARWGINVLRNRQKKAASPQELSAWFPNEKGLFHAPEAFGRIVF